MTPQDAQLLIQRYLTGDCTAEEEELLASWYRELHDESLWDIPAGQSAAIHDRMLSKIRTELAKEWPEPEEERQGSNGRVRRLTWRQYATVAAAVLIVAMGGWLWSSRSHEKPVDNYVSIDVKPGGSHATLTLGNGQRVILDSAANGMLAVQGENRIMKQNGQLDYKAGAGKIAKEELLNTLATPRGGQYKLILPDGTKVWLDASSSITYPTAFTGKARQVSITGQAYFEVVHDPKQPFEVSAQGQTIRDIGTSFNINAYADEPAMKVTLADGVAAVGPADHAIVLSKAGQQAEYRQGQLRPAPDADLESVLAWKNGLFYLTSADIATVMRQIGRWYDIDIVYDQGAPSGHITGQVPRNTNLSTVLRVLQTSGVHFTVQGKTIHVTP